MSAIDAEIGAKVIDKNDEQSTFLGTITKVTNAGWIEVKNDETGLNMGFFLPEGTAYYMRGHKNHRHYRVLIVASPEEILHAQQGIARKKAAVEEKKALTMNLQETIMAVSELQKRGWEDYWTADMTYELHGVKISIRTYMPMKTSWGGGGNCAAKGPHFHILTLPEMDGPGVWLISDDSEDEKALRA